MTDRYHSDTQEKTLELQYSPGVLDSGELEPSTSTITATAEASGLGNADYSKSLTLSSPDGLLTVLRVASRLAVTIDSMTAGHLYCRVYVDVQDAGHLLFDEDWTSVGSKLDAVDTHSGSLATVFDLLRDGGAHTFYFFLWVDAGNAVVSSVELWAGIGSCSTGWWPAASCLQINHQGLASYYHYITRIGTGTAGSRIVFSGDNAYLISPGSEYGHPCLLLSNHELWVNGTVATDLNYLSKMRLVLRSLL